MVPHLADYPTFVVFWSIVEHDRQQRSQNHTLMRPGMAGICGRTEFVLKSDLSICLNRPTGLQPMHGFAVLTYRDA